MRRGLREAELTVCVPYLDLRASPRSALYESLCLSAAMHLNAKHRLETEILKRPVGSLRIGGVAI